MKICKSEKGDALIKTMLIPLLIVVLTVTSFYAILNGVIEIVKAIVGKLVDDIEGAVSGGIQWLGLARVSTGLPTFVIYEQQVENLKNRLEAQSIDTEKCGITQVRLRKMLLAYAVSSSLSDTVCVAQITEEEMIKNYKEKEKIDEKTEVEINEVLNKYGSIDSTTKWKVSTPYYTLYYVDNTSQHTFFYFKDSSKKFGDNPDQWYIGAMGATTITTADDQTLNYVTDEDFGKIKENFDKTKLGDKLDSEAYKQMQDCYTKTGVDTIKMYTLDITQKEYYFSFENKNIENNKLEKPEQTEDEEFKYDVDADSVYNVGTQEINLSDSVDLSQYSIPIELMIDFLNMTGSGEFLETFIDFALNEINTQISAYSLNAESVAYNVRKYNIDSNFVIEMYNMVNEVWGDDAQSFEAYYDIIYNRKYNNSDLPENKVTKIDNYEDIGKTYRADGTFIASALEKYLKTAYDPGTDFSLGDIIVTEVESTRSEKNDWRLMVTTIETWYGKSTYTIPDAEEIYVIPDKTENATEEEYNNYNHTKITDSDFTNAEGQEKEIRYLYEGLLSQVEEGKIDTSKCNLQKSDDIYDNAMKTDSGADNRAHFQNWVMNGLAAIAQSDDGEKNSTRGAGKGTDYIYCKYKEINVKKSVAKEKTMQQIVDENNIVQQDTTSGTEEKIEKFLALLRNADGKIPDPLNSGVFTEKNDNPSIVVRYGDIYNGTIPVGDLLLDNGARMLFELLNTSDNTKPLIQVFKYMAYRYSGVDYGVTDISSFMDIFDLNPISEIYGGTIVEKIWFALIGAGYSKEVVAGIMGNLYAESGLNPSLAETGSKLSATGMTSEQYTAAVNKKTYSKNKFIYDQIGYGLMQWTYWSRKKGLYEYCQDKNINDEDAQIKYMLKELKSYKDARWVNAKTVEEATEQFCWLVENPDREKAHIETRKQMAQKYYNEMKDKEKGNYSGTAVEKMMQAAENIRVHCTKKNYQYDATQPDYKEGIRALWNKKGVCCASYVAWVLVEAGVVNEGTMNKIPYRGVNELYSGLIKTRKFKDMGTIPQENMQKGDIVFWLGHHTQMYAGNGYWFNGGALPPGPNVKHSRYNAPDAFSSYGRTYHVLRLIG